MTEPKENNAELQKVYFKGKWGVHGTQCSPADLGFKMEKHCYDICVNLYKITFAPYANTAGQHYELLPSLPTRAVKMCA